MPILHFHPIYQSRVWGGRALAERLGRELPEPGPIGEAWEIVDRPEAQSIDTATGKTLRQLLEQNSRELMGPDYPAGKPFPVLVKWLDCTQRLSLQVHPPADIAEQLGGEPKLECWYMAETRDQAALIVGLKKGVERSTFEQALSANQLEPLLHRFTVEPGQAMLLEPGRLHAIDAGNLILEIQQNSDTTYRVYDWGRTGLDGQPRPLHVAESLQCIDFQDHEPEPQPSFKHAGERTIADTAEFRIRQINLPAGAELSLEAGEQPRILSLIEGQLSDQKNHHPLPRSSNHLIPYTHQANLKAHTPSIILLTENFS